jgi:Bacterial Ig-like domain
MRRSPKGACRSAKCEAYSLKWSQPCFEVRGPVRFDPAQLRMRSSRFPGGAADCPTVQGGVVGWQERGNVLSRHLETWHGHQRDPMRSAGNGLAQAVALVLVAMAVGPVANSVAAPPDVTITSPADKSVSNNPTPSFMGLAEEGSGEVALRIYGGPIATGPVVQELSTTLLGFGDTWSLGPTELLNDGTYTARASQTNLALQTGTSAPVTFTVDTAAPSVTLNSLESPVSDPTPSFTGTASDTTTVDVQIHAGSTPKGTVVSTAKATGTGTVWGSGDASPALATGQYTAVAIQASSLGNPAGRSGPVTFSVSSPTVSSAAVSPFAMALAPGPPVATFTWFPPVPATGERVSLVSTSTDAAVPITGFAWSLTTTGPFQAGGGTLITSFPTPGNHTVRLRVTNRYGLSSLAVETIEVVTARPVLMQPFPVVRIAGTEIGSGVRLKLLKVQQIPAGARVIVRCKGHGCPLKTVKRVAVSGKRGVSPFEFRRFERFLPTTVTLEIFVSKTGEIGKYTRFVVRRGKLPLRVDRCLDPAGFRPLACPS